MKNYDSQLQSFFATSEVNKIIMNDPLINLLTYNEQSNVKISKIGAPVFKKNALKVFVVVKKSSFYLLSLQLYTEILQKIIKLFSLSKEEFPVGELGFKMCTLPSNHGGMRFHKCRELIAAMRRFALSYVALVIAISLYGMPPPSPRNRYEAGGVGRS